MLNTGMNYAETFQLEGLDPTLPLTAMSKAVHDHLGRSSHMLKSTNRAIWEGIEAFHGSGTAVGTGIRELASDAAAQSSRSMQVIVVAGAAFARVKCPADLMSAHQAVPRASSAELAFGLLRMGATIARTTRAASGHWPVSSAPAIAPTPVAV